MDAPDSSGWIYAAMWIALGLGTSVVALWLVVAAFRRRALSRWIAVSLAAAVVGTGLVTANLWINAAKIDGSNCTMDALSTALASGVTTAADKACLDSGRRRVGISGGVQAIVLAGSVLRLRKRGASGRVRRRRAAEI
ncbi:hypothetical protein [Nocardioides sp. Iso805N]|uniref:hypothetical protein n=1 Tax=Nocardioides sp. Iso805N TaxID=1283287 RepID=UPI00035EF2BE|nr:hypothetical protein [Nocardioides sp. Iso805N]